MSDMNELKEDAEFLVKRFSHSPYTHGPVSVAALKLARHFLKQCDADGDRQNLLDDTIYLIEEGWSYAGDYFREKWDSVGQTEEIKNRLASALGIKTTTQQQQTKIQEVDHERHEG